MTRRRATTTKDRPVLAPPTHAIVNYIDAAGVPCSESMPLTITDTGRYEASFPLDDPLLGIPGILDGEEDQ